MIIKLLMGDRGQPIVLSRDRIEASGNVPETNVVTRAASGWRVFLRLRGNDGWNASSEGVVLLRRGVALPDVSAGLLSDFCENFGTYLECC
jgi:hypothetical protein